MKHKQINPMLRAALKYARRGWRVHPLLDGGKRPRLTGWPEKATTDVDQIKEWWGKWPNANIGIVTGAESNLFIVDVDNKNRKNGETALSQLQNEYGSLPDTLQAKTPNGRHLYFQYPKSAKLGNNVSALAPGIDTRGERGYIVASPSVVNGSRYKWKHSQIEVAQLPAIWTRAIKYNNSSSQTDAEKGNRNNSVYRKALKMRKEDIPLKTAKEQILAYNDEHCSPPLDEKEVLTCLNSAYKSANRMSDLGIATGDSEKDQRILELAALPNLEYQIQRKAEAELIGINVAQLDAAIKKLQVSPDDDSGQGTHIAFDNDPEPWPDVVNGDELLQEIEGILNTYLILPPHSAVALALWILFTWTVDAFDISPIILLTSPVKRCGKTRTLSIVSRFVRRGLPAANATGPVMFRVIERYMPTLMFDEADTFLNDQVDLIGMINSGFDRSTASIMRTTGDNHEVASFSTWCPKLIATLKPPADTLVDRSIVIPMTRKLKGETVKPLSYRDQFPDVQAREVRWAADNIDALRHWKIARLKKLDDRANDRWEPLRMIAAQAGGDWPEKAEAAALALTKTDDAESIGVELLEDIRQIFELRDNPRSIGSTSLVLDLHKLDHRPWANWSGGSGLNPNTLARLLKPFRIKSRNKKVGGVQKKAYIRKQFEDAWSRYL